LLDAAGKRGRYPFRDKVLLRQGVPKSAVRILISAATGTGIEARSAVVSIFRQQSVNPAV
jgi:hypothetical protein